MMKGQQMDGGQFFDSLFFQLTTIPLLPKEKFFSKHLKYSTNCFEKMKYFSWTIESWAAIPVKTPLNGICDILQTGNIHQARKAPQHLRIATQRTRIHGYCKTKPLQIQPVALTWIMNQNSEATWPDCVNKLTKS